jgi:glycosyltransferase involved in cell wall biosynthesis
MKNVLFIIDSLGAGGAEKVVLTLARTMVHEGHNVTIISVDNKIEYHIDFPAHIHTLDFKKSRFEPTYYKYSIKLRNLVVELEKEHGKFDLITSHLQKAHRLTARAGLLNAYYVLHSTVSQGSLVGRTGLRLYFKRRRLKKLLDGKHIITVSNGIEEDLLKVVHIKPKSIRTIYNPVDFELIRELSKVPNPYKDEDYIIHVGRLTPSKRHDLLLEAYAKSGISQKLLLLGDGNLKEAIQQHAYRLDIAEKVIFAGFKTNPYSIIKDAKLSILASDYEGLGLALIESLALYIPVLSTDCPSGPREILTGSLSKYLMVNKDVDSIARHIVDTLQIKNDLSGDISYLEKKFSPQHASSEYLSLCLPLENKSSSQMT